MRRKIVSLLALTLIMLMAILMSSCTPVPPKDLDKIEDALEDEDYTVYYSDDEDELGVGITEQLYATNDDDTLAIIKFETTKLANLYYEELKLSNDQKIENLKLEIKKTKYILKHFEDDLTNDEIDSYEDQLKDLEKKLEKSKSEYVIGKSGKTIWYGNVDAIKDSRK